MCPNSIGQDMKGSENNNWMVYRKQNIMYNALSPASRPMNLIANAAV